MGTWPSHSSAQYGEGSRPITAGSVMEGVGLESIGSGGDKGVEGGMWASLWAERLETESSSSPRPVCASSGNSDHLAVGCWAGLGDNGIY